MINEVFVVLLGLTLAGLLRWAVGCLHKERWQILATVPRAKREDGSWSGTNLSTYGLITAASIVFAALLYLMLMGSIGVSLSSATALIVAIGLCAAPAARWVARIVEGKAHTLTVAGAAFVAVLVSPLAIAILNALAGPERPAIPMAAGLAAVAIAYVLGEGIGRLACISFGCCYGRPIDELPERWRPLFRRFHVVFHGETKKIAYASGLGGRPVVPVQAMTSAIYLSAGVLGIWLFLHGMPLAALALTLTVSHLWRAASEGLRADHRGGGKLTVYQWMSLATVALCALAVALLRGGGVEADLSRGLAAVWAPAPILMLQLLGLGSFLLTGWSMVTGSVLSFHVHRDRI